VLGGVAAGIADHFGIDALLVRLGFVVAAFFGGIGVIAYLVAWIVLPSATPGAPPAPRDNRQLLGFGLVALGLATIPSGLGFAWRLDGAFWPLALITLGGAVLWLRTRDDHDDRDDQPPPAPPPATPASSPTPTSSFAAEPGPAPTADATAPVSVPPAPRAAREARRAKPPRGPPPRSP
jgi:phage shock protein PspC (stress-responsive transcriptional regulator)